MKKQPFSSSWLMEIILMYLGKNILKKIRFLNNLKFHAMGFKWCTYLKEEEDEEEEDQKCKNLEKDGV